MDLTIRELQQQANLTAHKKGFWEHTDGSPSNIEAEDFVVKLALVHTEVSEVVEELRRFPGGREEEHREGEKPEGIGSELADIIIRVADLGQELNIDLTDCIQEKMAYNETRLYRHGKAF